MLLPSSGRAILEIQGSSAADWLTIVINLRVLSSITHSVNRSDQIKFIDCLLLCLLSLDRLVGRVAETERCLHTTVLERFMESWINSI